MTLLTIVLVEEFVYLDYCKYNNDYDDQIDHYSHWVALIEP